MSEIEDGLFDDYDNLIHLESIYEDQGRNDAIKDCEIDRTGYKQGYALGTEQGNAIGGKIGYYIGFAETWLQEVSSNLSKYPPRTMAKLQLLLNESLEFPMVNDIEGEDPNLLLKKMKGHFQVAKLLVRSSSSTISTTRNSLAF